MAKRILCLSAVIILSSHCTPHHLGEATTREGEASRYLRKGTNYLGHFKAESKGRSFRKFSACVGSSKIPTFDYLEGPVSRLPDDMVVILEKIGWYHQGGHRWYYAVFKTQDPRIAPPFNYEINLGLSPVLGEDYGYVKIE